jgi:hypothetical protein
MPTPTMNTHTAARFDFRSYQTVAATALLLTCAFFVPTVNSAPSNSGVTSVSDARDPISPALAIELADGAALGYLSRAGKEPAAFLFVDVECSVCHEAVNQVKRLAVPVLIVPIAVYAPVRKHALSSAIEANTSLFRDLGYHGLPLWIIRSACGSPLVIEGALTEQEIASLAPVSVPCEGARNGPMNRRHPTPLGIMF